MTVITEVRDAIGVIVDVVEKTRSLLKVVSDGREYLRKRHPDARADLAALLEQMRTTVVGLHSASRVVTDFDFTIDGSDRDRQPARFNDHLLRFQEQVALLQQDISALKGSCHRVLVLSTALEHRAGDQPWFAMLGDRAGKRAGELSTTLHELYQLDNNMAIQARLVLAASEESLNAVRAELRGGAAASAASVANVDRAAAVLHEQAEALRPEIARLLDLRNALEDEIRALD